MRTKRMPRAVGGTLFSLATLVLPVLMAGGAQAHGYTENPPSRQALCAGGQVRDCGSIQYEPQSVEGPGNFPQAGPPDGKLCSAGKANFGQLDDPRGGKWPAAGVQAGQEVQFRWKNTASHPTKSYRYFITKEGWDPMKPLTRDQVEPAPFLNKDFGGHKPGPTESHPVKLPAGKKGHHVVIGVWDIADTSNAFYSCSDVNFG